MPNIDKIKEIFPDSYINITSENKIEEDFNVIANMQSDFSISTYCTEENINHLKLYSTVEYNLSQIIPVLENMGFNVIKQVTHELKVDGKIIFLQNFSLKNERQECILSTNLDYMNKLEDGLRLILTKQVINDELNSLLSTSNLKMEEIKVLRALVAYMQQIGTKHSLNEIRDIYATNIKISELIVDLFLKKFDPTLSQDKRDEQVKQAKVSIKTSLKFVNTLDEEIILRDSMYLIDAMLRTNYFAIDSMEDALVFKFESAKVPNMPKPAPLYEIFVYNKIVQGVHLRGGKVARGGLRWSDRPADFRSEILGLVKTQITKNAVIVPTGSKGGFVIQEDTKGLNRAQFQELGITCYKKFITGLLSVTDNIVKGDIITPANIVRYDEQDPYLVVAADKGTATFSDIANQISIDHNFWLQDAFASGGKNGYDHKKMGITAKGAWESVKRHFRHFDIDTQKQDFTVVGIGGMNGDVFGNGMILSEKINLVAAFNHEHIFLDPKPNTKVSFDERQRLFDNVQSWSDYNKDIISNGGGIYLKTDKSIKITDEVKALFDIQEDELSPNKLIKKLMMAKVDLLWNGGIGTFVKASTEDNQDVPDRANDVIRVDGNQLRAKVMGEGGNLGFTQKGRIEFANCGGKIYTDAIDNSAGVSCSDNEVNIKILLSQAIANGKLKESDRNALLESMEQDIEDKVLLDNYDQGSLIDLEFANNKKNMNYYKDIMNCFEAEGLLDRAVEDLPSNEEMDTRMHAGENVLTTPEISVLLAYVKIALTNRLLETSLVKVPSSEKFLMNYFPKALHKYEDEIKSHKLKDDIIAMQIANLIVNKMGLAFIAKMRMQTVSTVEDIVRSFLITQELFDLPTINDAINSLDNKVNASAQVSLFDKLELISENQCLWFMRHLPKPLHFKESIDLLRSVMDKTGIKLDSNYKKLDVKQLNKKLNDIIKLQDALDLGLIAYKTESSFTSIKKLDSEIDTQIALNSIVKGIKAINTTNMWEEIASKEFINELNDVKSNFITEVLNEKSTLSDFIQNRRLTLHGFVNEVEQINLDQYNYSVVKVLTSRLKSLLD